MSSSSGEDTDWAEFLDRLVHDMREPLRSVHAFTELLSETAKDRLGVEGEEAFREILSGTTRIRALIDGLSGYSLALRESADSPASQGVSLQLAFDIVLDALDNEIRACGATVTAENLPKVSVSLERLTQLLENLIGNSLKFKGDAPPVVRVSARPEATGWAIEVEDNGMGIDSADIEKVFKPFTRVQGRRHPGAGLGLPACRKIVEAHGGEIRMRPRADGGLICAFWLPAA
ncbi:MAG: ATP-binding protein [Bryobacteraceae bacterium]|jgi:light-regulated signal transduction histidine kinase (bacteriophytochrome)